MMAQPQRTEALLKEGKWHLATSAFQSERVKTKKRAALLYAVPHMTLRRGINGIHQKHETTPINLKLSLHEDQSLVHWTLDLDRRGFPPHIMDVRRMADVLRARGQNPPPQPLGRKWASRFVQRQSELQIEWDRKFHSQRCEDPVKIQAWFKRVQDTRDVTAYLIAIYTTLMRQAS
jgi:hypothetical protein